MISSLLSIDFRIIAGIFAAICALFSAATAFYSYFRTVKSDEKVFFEQTNKTIYCKDLEAAEAGKGLKIDKDNPFFSNISFRIYERLISNNNDLFDFYRGDTEKHYATFQDFLLNYKYWLTCVEEISYNGNNLKRDQIKSVFKFVSAVLQEEENKTLFKGVSQNDRSSLLAIQSLIIEEPNKIAISRELELLSLSLLHKQETLKWQNIMSVSSLFLSILGILATILLSH